jgi:hypothetical protein
VAIAIGRTPAANELSIRQRGEWPSIAGFGIQRRTTITPLLEHQRCAMTDHLIAL